MRPLLPTAVASAAVLVATVLAAPTSVAAVDPAAYGDSMGVVFGANVHSAMPVTLDLPVPGDGRRVAKVRFSWQQRTPTTYNQVSWGSKTVETPDCVADQPCTVEAVLSTARMHNSLYTRVSINVSDDAATTIGTAGRDVHINNPKPTVEFTAPGGYTAQWGEATLSATATPSSSDVPLKGVRFYVRPNGKEDDPYRFDATPPYSVTMPALEIADSTHQGTLVVVAEDVEGNLSLYTQAAEQAMRRYVYVGPPPIVSWPNPGADGRPAGGMSTEALLGWSTVIPDSAPPSETTPSWPYIERVQLFRDGEQWSDTRWNNPNYPFWGDGSYQPKLRQARYTHVWKAAHGMTPGEHTVTLRVTTSYNSVGTVKRTFVVTDGVVFSDVMSRDRVVKDGFIVTAGTWVPLRYTVAGKVPGSAMQYYDILHGQESLTAGRNGCTNPAWWDCPEKVTVRGEWSVPAEPGTYTLTFAAQESGDAQPSEFARTITVQPAASLPAGVSTNTVVAGRAVAVRGRVVRVDTGRGVAGVPVTLQWRRAGTTRWVMVASRTTDRYGKVRALPVRRVTGSYRWRTPGVLGKIGPARSALLKVKVVSGQG